MSDGALKYGGHESTTVISSNNNFIGAAFNGLSLSCTPIELLANDGSDAVVGNATGFFWKKDGKSYLVTNWHVVSGRSPFTGGLGSNGYIPKRIIFHGMSMSVQSGIISFERRRWLLRWGEDMIDLLSKPPEFEGKPIDIWGVPISSDIVFGRDPDRVGFKSAADISCYINENAGSRIVTNVGDDCFILGYPLQNYEGLMPPIWKRGSISSETIIGVGGHPIFLVDAATTPGMSGSPIIRKVVTLTADNRDIGALQEISSYEMIGVYAGRLQSKQLAAVNIGYGWHRTMIDEAINHYKFSPAETFSNPA